MNPATVASTVIATSTGAACFNRASDGPSPTSARSGSESSGRPRTSAPDDLCDMPAEYAVRAAAWLFRACRRPENHSSSFAYRLLCPVALPSPPPPPLLCVGLGDEDLHAGLFCALP